MDETPDEVGIVEANQGQLTRAVTAYLCALTFAATFVLALAFGARLGTALLRGVLVLLATRIVTPVFIRAGLHAVLDAMARDQAEVAVRTAADSSADGEPVDAGGDR